MVVWSVLFLVAVISLPPCFLWNIQVVFMHRCYLECWRAFFLLLFLTHTVCQRHLWGVRPYALSLVFLFSDLIVEVLLSSILRMVPSILRKGQPWYLSLWWDFHYVVWFRVVFSFSWVIIFYFFFHRYVSWCPLPKFPNICKFLFLRAFCFFFSWFVFFLHSVICSFPPLVISMAHFSMLNSIRISSVYPLCMY